MTRQSFIPSPVRQTPVRYFGGLGVTFLGVELLGYYAKRRLG